MSARLNAAGWKLCINEEVYHVFKETWRSLWAQYVWWGYGGHYISHKHKGIIIFWRHLPPLVLVSGFFRVSNIYRKTNRKASILLPFQRAFKETAWSIGFVKSHLDRYGQSYENQKKQSSPWYTVQRYVFFKTF